MKPTYVYLLLGDAFSDFYVKCYKSIDALLKDPENDLEITDRHFRKLRADNQKKQQEKINTILDLGGDDSELRNDGYPLQYDGFKIYKEVMKGNKELEINKNATLNRLIRHERDNQK
jgi:hypothetical protein